MQTRRLVPTAFVADVERTIAYYRVPGFEVKNTFTPPEADAPAWARLTSGGAQLMVARASDPVVAERCSSACRRTTSRPRTRS